MQVEAPGAAVPAQKGVGKHGRLPQKVGDGAYEQLSLQLERLTRGKDRLGEEREGGGGRLRGSEAPVVEVEKERGGAGLRPCPP